MHRANGKREAIPAIWKQIAYILICCLHHKLCERDMYKTTNHTACKLPLRNFRILSSLPPSTCLPFVLYRCPQAKMEGRRSAIPSLQQTRWHSQLQSKVRTSPQGCSIPCAWDLLPCPNRAGHGISSYATAKLRRGHLSWASKTASKPLKTQCHWTWPMSKAASSA